MFCYSRVLTPIRYDTVHEVCWTVRASIIHTCRLQILMIQILRHGKSYHDLHAAWQPSALSRVPTIASRSPPYPLRHLENTYSVYRRVVTLEVARYTKYTTAFTGVTCILRDGNECDMAKVMRVSLRIDRTARGSEDLVPSCRKLSRNSAILHPWDLTCRLTFANAWNSLVAWRKLYVDR